MTSPARRLICSWAMGIVIAMVSGLSSTPASAQPAPSEEVSGKVLLLGSADDPAVLRMRDELRLLGLRVQVLDTNETVDVARLAERLSAEAVAEIESWPPEIRIWVQGTEGDPSTLAIGDSLTDGEPELLALRAVELLRARLLPVPPGEGPAAPPDVPSPAESPGASPSPVPPAPISAVATPPTLDAAAEPDRTGPEPDRIALEPMRPLGIFFGPALATQPGGPMPAFQIAAGLEYRVHPRMSVAIRTLLPTHGATLGTPEGEAMVRTLALGGAGRVWLTDPEGDVGVVATGGFGAVGLFYQGESRGGGRGMEGSSWAASPFVALAARYVLTPVWALRFEAETSLLLPRQVIRIAGEDAGDVGFPAVGLSAGVEVWP